VDFVRRWSEKTEIGAGRFIGWLDITASKFYDWRERFGKVNEHNGWVPRDFWLEDWEKQAIIGFHLKSPLEGYRRLTFMMLGRHCGGESDHMAGAGASGTVVEVERQAVEEEHGL
jgi:putative transposase